MAKTTPKKAAVKKPVKKITETEKLANELKTLIPKLDEEGLAFLVKQAHVHLYNMQVDALNKNIINETERKNKAATKTKKTAITSNKNFTDIKISESGSGYHILCNNQWISFTSKEISSMVKIAFGEGTDLEVRGRLYNWLLQERSDLLITASIKDKFDENLKALVTLLKKNFKLK